MSDSVAEKILLWFGTGQVGLSSKAMAMWLGMGRQPQHSDAHPHDPDDLDRCLQLLEAVPELRVRLPAMRGVSPHWAALVERWDEIEKSHLDEVGLRWTKAWSAPRTYALMRRILSKVPDAGAIDLGDMTIRVKSNKP